MHERNRYKIPPDFKELAKQFPQLQPFLKINNNKCYVNFRDPHALLAVTRALLKIDFNLNVELPMDRLIPTVPLRLNYIHWLEDIINVQCDKPVFGIDIGTGASCIYPLLAARMNGWNFLATEVDSKCIHYAQKNVTTNGLDDKIKVKAVAPHDILYIPLKDDSKQQYDFCMCNPPFFNDSMDAQGANRTSFRPQPKSICTGDGGEIIYDGGEVEFVKAMIEDSVKLLDRVKCYTSMLGKKSSVDCLVSIIREKKIKSYTTSVFSQGKTTRWSVAWSFCYDLPDSEMNKRKEKAMKPMYVNITCGSEALPQLTEINLEIASNEVKRICKDLQIKLDSTSADTDGTKQTYNGTACRNTWIHQRRKRRLLLRQQNMSKDSRFKPDEDGTSTIDSKAKKLKMDASNELLNTDEETILEPGSSCCTSILQSSQELNEAASTDDARTTSSEALLQFSLVIAKLQYLKPVDSACQLADCYAIKLEFENGQKDALCQLCQYFRNKLEIRK